MSESGCPLKNEPIAIAQSSSEVTSQNLDFIEGNAFGA